MAEEGVWKEAVNCAVFKSKCTACFCSLHLKPENTEEGWFLTGNQVMGKLLTKIWNTVNWY